VILTGTWKYGNAWCSRAVRQTTRDLTRFAYNAPFAKSDHK